MGKKSDDDTRVILKNLGLICPAFYAIYFVVATLLALAFKLDCSSDGSNSCRYEEIPFYHKMDDFRPEGNDKAMVAWISQVGNALPRFA